MRSTIAFRLVRNEELAADVVVPVIDGVPLTDGVHAFERERGMERRARSYDGVNRWFSHRSFAPVSHRAAVLGCTCGEVGCWPLVTEMVVTATEVTWTRFEQPHRLGRDYTGFGPFTFAREEYEAALDAIA